MNAPSFLTAADLEGDTPLVQSLEKRRLRIYAAFLVLDICILAFSFAVSSWLTNRVFAGAGAMAQAQVMAPLFLTIALYNRAYSMRAMEAWNYAAFRAVLSLLIAAALLSFITFYLRAEDYSRAVFTLAISISAIGLVVSRYAIVGQWQPWGRKLTNVLVVHDGGPKVPLEGAIHVDASQQGIRPDPNDPHALNKLGQMMTNMDRVLISCPISRRMEWSFVLRSAGVNGGIVTERLNELRPLRMQNDNGLLSLVVSAGPLGMRDRVLKRAFDTALSGTALIALSPLLILTALAIKLEDRGPVFFVQRRLGKGNCFFDMWKFRSMKVARLDADGKQSTARDDDRVTKVGKFIRSTSIDELPQIINVLRGEMSIVGPRPHALGSQAGDKLFWEVDPEYWRRHALKPGLTGLAQVRGFRGATEQESDLQHRLGADLEYISNWSLLTDIAIVFATAKVLVHQRAF
ncbi:exopolysaccharide biosynthesis polyprenyl glycosylphosphotransferase [Qipengyuania sp. DSG2-2]|uniref:exopolysaccharide biosynthesis polyprenyl glycosylphosphotransferase n=1 Tax=Qipengyuania sp. DGS2-2 TaxID=3349631 RepID=UPI0036D3EBC0